MKNPQVIGSYQTVINGQVVTVQQYEATKANEIERDTSRLSFHRRYRNRPNNTAYRGPKRPIVRR